LLRYIETPTALESFALIRGQAAIIDYKPLMVSSWLEFVGSFASNLLSLFRAAKLNQGAGKPTYQLKELDVSEWLFCKLNYGYNQHVGNGVRLCTPGPDDPYWIFLVGVRMTTYYLLCAAVFFHSLH